MTRLLKPLWFVLALIFLIEAWLWDHLEPLVARIVRLIPLAALKQWLARRIEALPPSLALVVFLLPTAFLLPLKFVGVWLIAHHHFMAALAVAAFVKLAGLGVTAFIFDLTRPRLLEMRWFRRLYETVVALRARAHALVAPIMDGIRAQLRAITGGRGAPRPRLLRVIRRYRRRLHMTRAASL